MDIKTKQEENQEVFTKDTEKKTRAEKRRQADKEKSPNLPYNHSEMRNFSAKRKRSWPA